MVDTLPYLAVAAVGIEPYPFVKVDPVPAHLLSVLLVPSQPSSGAPVLPAPTVLSEAILPPPSVTVPLPLSVISPPPLSVISPPPLSVIFPPLSLIFLSPVAVPVLLPSGVAEVPPHVNC